MTTRRSLLRTGMTALLAGAGLGRFGSAIAAGAGRFEITRTDAEWRKLLRGDVYEVMRRSGTERPFTSDLLHEVRTGTFTCAGCERDLFASHTKFESGTGWPSFWQPLPGSVLTQRDTSFGMARHPDAPYIVANDLPKIGDLERLFPERFRGEPVLTSGTGTASN